MSQENSTTHIDITLQQLGEEMSCLTLSVGEPQKTTLHLSLQEARKLAGNLIQHVHLAEVSNSLKKTALKAV